MPIINKMDPCCCLDHLSFTLDNWGFSPCFSGLVRIAAHPADVQPCKIPHFVSLCELIPLSFGHLGHGNKRSARLLQHL